VPLPLPPNSDTASLGGGILGRVRLEAIGGNFALGEEGEAVIDHIVAKNAAIGVFRGLGRIEAQHIGQDPILIDRGDCFLAGVIAGMPHQVDELIEPALAIVNRLAETLELLRSRFNDNKKPKAT
jgi:hypothetical protein